MSKMSELAAILDELVDCGKTLTATAEKLREVFSGNGSSGDDKTESTGAGAAAPEKPAQEAQPKAITLEEVRAALAEKSRSGKTVAVKELLTKHGANRLSDVDPAEYAALLAEAEVL